MEVFFFVVVLVVLVAAVSGGTGATAPVLLGGDTVSKGHGCASSLAALALVVIVALYLAALVAGTVEVGPVEVGPAAPTGQPVQPARVAPGAPALRPVQPASGPDVCSSPPGRLGEIRPNFYAIEGRSVPAVCTVDGWKAVK